MYLELICVFTLIFAYSLFQQSKQQSSRSPPGPWAFPIIGNLGDLVLDGGPHITVCKWAAKYGPVLSYKIGSQKMIAISDPKLVKQLFSMEVATGRPRNPVFDAYSNNRGVVLSDGPNWETQRPFLIKSLKQFGFGKASTLEDRVLEEFSGLATLLEESSNVPIAGNGLFFPFLTGTVWKLMVSDVDDKEKDKVAELVEDFMRAVNATTGSGLMFFPVLRFIAPGFFGWTEFKRNLANLREFVTSRINRNIAQLNASNPTGFMDHFLIEMKSTVDETSTFCGDLGFNNLVALVTDMFITSIDTTGVTLEWGMIYLSQQRGVQSRLQEEIDDVIGKSRAPYLSDRKQMPYTEAVILEIVRHSSIIGLGIPHRLVESIDDFHGYHLEKDSLLVPNLYSILHEPSLWGTDAGEFNPDRFLNEEKSKPIRNNQAFLPFSIGKRKCLGEHMAMDTLFLFVTCVFQKFSVEPDPEFPVADLRAIPGLTMAPKPFRIVVSPRRQDFRYNIYR